MWCPNCKADRAHRSHRAGVKEHLASLVAYYPYRCRECKHRFLHSRNAAPEAPPSVHRSTEREIRATRRAKEWHRKKRYMAIYGIALVLFLVFIYLLTRDRGENARGNARLATPIARTVG
jgi:hypothetical protein